MLSKVGIRSAKGLVHLHISPKTVNVSAVRLFGADGAPRMQRKSAEYDEREHARSDAQKEYEAADRGQKEVRKAVDELAAKARARAQERAEELNKVEKASIAETHGSNEALEEAKANANKVFEDAARGVSHREYAGGATNMSRDAMDYMDVAKQNARETAKLSQQQADMRAPPESTSKQMQDYMNEKAAGKTDSMKASTGQSQDYKTDKTSGMQGSSAAKGEDFMKTFNSAKDNATGSMDSMKSSASQPYGFTSDTSAGQGSQVRGPNDLNQTQARTAQFDSKAYDSDRNTAKDYGGYNQDTSDSSSTFEKMKEKAASAYETVKEKVQDAYEAVIPKSDKDRF